MESEPAKVVVVGDSGVGKTSIISKFAGDEFDAHIQPTIVTSNVLKEIDIDGTVVPLNLLDTAGQERFQSLIPLYLRGADSCLFVTDITDSNAIDVLDAVWDLFQQNSDERCYCILCGNKADLAPEDISTAEFDSWAKSHNMCFIPTSAKTGENIDFVFNDVAKNILERRTVPMITKLDMSETEDFHSKKNCC